MDSVDKFRIDASFTANEETGRDELIFNISVNDDWKMPLIRNWLNFRKIDFVEEKHGSFIFFIIT